MKTLLCYLPIIGIPYTLKRVYNSGTYNDPSFYFGGHFLGTAVVQAVWTGLALILMFR